jgi:HK97 family phage portal protein
VIGRWLERRVESVLEKRYGTLDLFRDIYGGRETMSGESVNASRAIEVATVFACIRVIASGIAQVPWRIYQETGNTRQPAKAHPAYELIYRQPNPWQTSYSFRETMMFHVLLTGNAYAWKGMVGSDRRIRRLDLFEPNQVRVVREGDELRYEVRPDDGPAMVFPQSQIWHIRGPSWNGWLGLDATKLARDAIGLSIATERQHAELHGKGSKIGGLLSVEDNLSAEKFKMLEAWIDQHGSGGARAHKPLIVDRGAKFTPFGMTGVDSQHLETRKHQIEEICRVFGVLPIMVGHADKTATYASAEQMFLAHVVHTLSPWYERIEQSADISLLTNGDRNSGHYTKFTPNALMRGAAKDRAEFYTKALGAGGHGTAWMKVNEVRALEELDPVDGGDEIPAPPEPAQPEPAPPAGPTGEDG